MWKYNLKLMLASLFFAFFLWLTFITLFFYLSSIAQSKEIKTVTHIVILKHDGDLVEHYMYKKNTPCETISKELKSYRLYGVRYGYFADYFFKCKPYVRIQ